MTTEQEKFREINEMSDSYMLYLREQEVSEEDCIQAIYALKALVWQAGEQMEYFLYQTKNGFGDGKRFSMLVGFAYSILNSMEDAAEMARIGDSNYSIISRTDFIKHKKIYNTEGQIDGLDWKYFKFLRSLICAHPLSTNYSNTINGFLPSNKHVFCKYVDLISDHGGFDDPIYDYCVSLIYDSGNDLQDDILIVSSEILLYVKARFRQLLDTIHSEMKKRIEETIDLLKNHKITLLADEPNLKQFELLIRDDWRRNGRYHYDLMWCKVALDYAAKHPSMPFCNELVEWIWAEVKKIRELIQSMGCKDFLICNSASNLLESIGFDSNQQNNFR